MNQLEQLKQFTTVVADTGALFASAVMFWLTVWFGWSSTASATFFSDLESESSWVRMESSSIRVVFW